MPVYTKLKEISRLTIFIEQTFLTFPADYTNILIGEVVWQIFGYWRCFSTQEPWYRITVKSQTNPLGLHNTRKKVSELRHKKSMSNQFKQMFHLLGYTVTTLYTVDRLTNWGFISGIISLLANIWTCKLYWEVGA